MIKRSNTLILIDWDNTLNPTSHTIKNNIDINNPKNKSKHIHYFKELDNTLYNLLTNIIKYGRIVIVTNAMEKWIDITTDILPKTKDIIYDNIDIISARDKYQKKYPFKQYMWKKHSFAEVVSKHFTNDDDIENIISIGDADYEFKALIDLYKTFDDKKRLLKSIRFMKSPSYICLLDQLDVLNKNFGRICNYDGHIDHVFERKY